MDGPYVFTGITEIDVMQNISETTISTCPRIYIMIVITAWTLSLTVSVNIRNVNIASSFTYPAIPGVGRFVDKTDFRTFRRQYYKRNTSTPWLFKLLLFSFIIGLKYFQFVFRSVTRHLASGVKLGSGCRLPLADSEFQDPIQIVRIRFEKRAYTNYYKWRKLIRGTNL